MENYYQGKKIWITGASSGIGEALALSLSEQGAELIVSGRSEDKLQLLAAQLKVLGTTSVEALAFDLGRMEDREEAVLEVKKRWGAPDILVLNGGISQRSLIDETEFAVYQKLIEVDYLANVHLSKAFLEDWRRNRQGQVVVTSSLVGKFGTPYRSGYAAAKHALHGYFDTLRAEANSYHLKVNMICPGFIHTQVSVNALIGNGSALGEMDQAQAKGMSPSKFAEKALRAVEQNKAEVYIGGKEVLGVYLKRFLPSVFRRMITSASVR